MKYFSIVLLALSLTLTACQKKEDASVIKVGTISGPETELMEIAKAEAKKEYGLKVKIVEFTDYNIPNVALNDKSIDANVFQHQPYLDETLKKTPFKLVPIGKTFVFPMGGYSKKHKSIADLPEKAIVAIPNDPTNQARALLLLEKARLIQLKSSFDTSATPMDIVNNPKQLVIKPMDAALLVRVLPDVDLAIINTTFAVQANLLPHRDALLAEGPESLYANLIVVREEDKDKPQMMQLVKAFQSKAVENAAKKLFQGQAIPAWK